MYGLLWYGNIWLRYNYLKIWNLRVQKTSNIEKITFKVVQMKFLAMHITNKKLRFVFTWSLLNILMIFGIKRKTNYFDPYNLFLAIATNIPVILMTGFVLQGHIYIFLHL